MPADGGPGQQAIAKAIRAIPVTRATAIATPEGCSPSSKCTTSDGATSNPNPVAASAAAAKGSTFFKAVTCQVATRLPTIENRYCFGASIGSGSGAAMGPSSAFDADAALCSGSSVNVSLLILPVNLNGGS